MFQEPLELDDIKGFFMGSLQNNQGSNTGPIGFPPPGGAQAPLVSWLQTWKIKIGHWRAQVIAPGAGEFQEFLRHDGTDYMGPGITWSGTAVAIPVKSGERF